MTVIGISGRMGSGKDSIADVLVSRFGFVRHSMADALRIEAAEMLDTMIAPVDCPDNVRKIIEFGYWEPEAVYIKPTPPDIRVLLQWVGVWRRERYKDYWIKPMRVTISRDLSTSANIVIPDIRFENEVDLVREFSGHAWLTTRGKTVYRRHTEHISEQFCNQYRGWDLRIANDGTLAELEAKVSDIMRCHKEIERCSELLAKPESLSKSDYDGICGGQIDWQRELHEIAH